jgi:hypothetical protein
MRKILTLAIFLVFHLSLTAQQVISSGGGFFTDLSGNSMTFTIGEVVIGTFPTGAASNAILTQGFNQPLPNPEIQLLSGANTLACGGDFFFPFTEPGSSSVRLLTIRNEGGANLTVSGLSLGGDAVFTIENGPMPPFSIAPGQQEVLTLRFLPTAEQAYTGTLTITNTDSDEGACVVNLSATAVIPTMGQWAFFLFGLTLFTLMVVGLYSIKLKVESVK